MDRRDFLKLSGVLLTYLPFLSKEAIASEKKPALERVKLSELEFDAEKGAVYHCDFPEEDRFHMMLTNIRNHLSAYDFDPFQIKIIVVANGEGLKFFLKDHKGTKWEKEKIDVKRAYERTSSLTNYDVEFYVCQITIRGMKLKEENLFEFVKVVPSGVATVSELQYKGFAYIKVM